MASLLCICDQGYRASIEEQDDTVIWLAHMLQKQEGTKAALLLRGSAVNYAYAGQQSTAVQFGDWKQAHPADFPRDLAKYTADGGAVYVLAEDLERYGLQKDSLIDGVNTVPRESISKLVDEYDNVSFW